MNKFTSLLIACSLALAGAAYAQQPEEQSTPGAGKKEKTEKAEPKTPKTRGANTANPEATARPGPSGLKERGAGTGNELAPGKGRKVQPMEKSGTGASTETGVSAQTGGTPATTETGTGKGHKGRAKAETSTSTGTSASTEPTAGASVTPGGKHQRGEKAAKGTGAGANAKASPSATPVTAATANAAATSATAAPSASAAPSVGASASAAPSVAATGQQNATTNANAPATTGAATTHVEKQKVEQVKQQTATIKQQHVNFRAERRPDKVPPVTFNVNYRIQGSDRWSGPQYEVYRSYHPERHDRGWYHSRYHRVELIAGGYYYFNNGYWYPAWGYDPGQEYYAYDAPIYVGHRAEPPDRVIADVQAALQEMGYYRGEVDGLTGPLTREALAAYQADQGLQVTAVMDEPTLDSLNLSS